MPRTEDAPPPPGLRLRTWRTLRRKLQQDLALELGCSQQMISGIELGTESPGPELRRTIAKITEGQVPETAWEQSESDAHPLSVAS